MLPGELTRNRNRSQRSHGIDWAKSNVPQGFDHLPDQLRDVNGFQLTVRKNLFGRVTGPLLDNRFYVCWLDPQP